MDATSHIGSALLLTVALATTSAHAAPRPDDGAQPVDAAHTTALEATPRSMLFHLDREGSVWVLARLARQHALFDDVFRGIETADPAWLRVAQRLRGQADGAVAEGLDTAVARALPENPSRVLALVDHGFALERICTSPFIEPEPGVAESYASRTLAALRNVGSPASGSLADACAQRVTLPLR